MRGEFVLVWALGAITISSQTGAFDSREAVGKWEKIWNLENDTATLGFRLSVSLHSSSPN